MEKAVEKIIEGLIELGFKLIGLLLILIIGFRLVKFFVKLLTNMFCIYSFVCYHFPERLNKIGCIYI